MNILPRQIRQTFQIPKLLRKGEALYNVVTITLVAFISNCIYIQIISATNYV